MKINFDKLGFGIFRHSLFLPTIDENTKTKNNLVNTMIVKLIITKLFFFFKEGQSIKIFWEF